MKHNTHPHNLKEVRFILAHISEVSVLAQLAEWWKALGRGKVSYEADRKEEWGGKYTLASHTPRDSSHQTLPPNTNTAVVLT